MKKNRNKTKDSSKNHTQVKKKSHNARTAREIPCNLTTSQEECKGREKVAQPGQGQAENNPLNFNPKIPKSAPVQPTHHPNLPCVSNHTTQGPHPRMEQEAQKKSSACPIQRCTASQTNSRFCPAKSHDRFSQVPTNPSRRSWSRRARTHGTNFSSDVSKSGLDCQPRYPSPTISCYATVPTAPG